jgi:hypothetical protein
MSSTYKLEIPEPLIADSRTRSIVLEVPSLAYHFSTLSRYGAFYSLSTNKLEIDLCQSGDVEISLGVSCLNSPKDARASCPLVSPVAIEQFFYESMHDKRVNITAFAVGGPTLLNSLLGRKYSLVSTPGSPYPVAPVKSSISNGGKACYDISSDALSPIQTCTFVEKGFILGYIESRDSDGQSIFTANAMAFWATSGPFAATSALNVTTPSGERVSVNFTVATGMGDSGSASLTGQYFSASATADTPTNLLNLFGMWVASTSRGDIKFQADYVGGESSQLHSLVSLSYSKGFYYAKYATLQGSSGANVQAGGNGTYAGSLSSFLLTLDQSSVIYEGAFWGQAAGDLRAMDTSTTGDISLNFTTWITPQKTTKPSVTSTNFIQWESSNGWSDSGAVNAEIQFSSFATSIYDLGYYSPLAVYGPAPSSSYYTFITTFTNPEMLQLNITSCYDVQLQLRNLDDSEIKNSTTDASCAFVSTEWRNFEVFAICTTNSATCSAYGYISIEISVSLDTLSPVLDAFSSKLSAYYKDNLFQIFSTGAFERRNQQNFQPLPTKSFMLLGNGTYDTKTPAALIDTGVPNWDIELLHSELHLDGSYVGGANGKSVGFITKSGSQADMYTQADVNVGSTKNSKLNHTVSWVSPSGQWSESGAVATNFHIGANETDEIAPKQIFTFNITNLALYEDNKFIVTSNGSFKTYDPQHETSWQVDGNGTYVDNSPEAQLDTSKPTLQLDLLHSSLYIDGNFKGSATGRSVNTFSQSGAAGEMVLNGLVKNASSVTQGLTANLVSWKGLAQNSRKAAMEINADVSTRGEPELFKLLSNVAIDLAVPDGTKYGRASAHLSNVYIGDPKVNYTAGATYDTDKGIATDIASTCYWEEDLIFSSSSHWLYIDMDQYAPSSQPTPQPSAPSNQPTPQPTFQPTSSQPTSQPSSGPTSQPTSSPPTSQPSSGPTSQPTSSPPTSQPSSGPTSQPTSSQPTSQPSSSQPTSQPSSSQPTSQPSSSQPTS